MLKKKLHLLALLLISSLLLSLISRYSFALSSKPKLSANPAVQSYINNIATQYHFNAQELTSLFNSTAITPWIIPSMQHPYEEQPWYIYQKRFITEQRIALGLSYWQKHAAALRYAAETYGIPESVIVAVIGIETMYGHIFLRHPVLNSLITLSFFYPARATFFQNELTQYLLLTRDLHIDPHLIYGSYAGAIGLPQFMPSSYRRFAVKYCTTSPINEAEQKNNSDDAKTRELGDLINDSDDVIVSVANYLNHFGWQKDQPIAIKIDLTDDKYKEIMDNKPKSGLTLKQLQQYQITHPTIQQQEDTKISLIQLQNKDIFEYWLGLNNFNTLFHYNSNKHYIMTVYQLATLLKERYER